MLLHRSCAASASAGSSTPSIRGRLFVPQAVKLPCKHRGHAQQSQRSTSEKHHGLGSSTASRRIPPHTRVQREQTKCRSTVQSEPLPDDLSLELNPDETAKDVTYDEASKTVKIPLAALNDGKRRTKMVMFTCNQCGGRSARLVNPVAWERGAVFCQCQHCGVWHTLAAAPHIIEEIRYNDPEWQGPGSAKAATEAGSGDGSSLQQSSDTVFSDAASDGEQDVTSAALGGTRDQQEAS